MSKPVRLYTFRSLKNERGWPYSRQHTQRLIKAGRFPKPKKAPGGSFNIWTSEQIDEYYAALKSTATEGDAATIPNNI